MIKVIKSNDRFRADFGWLDTRWHFSFSDYYDPDNMNWSALRVFNDDVIQGGGGFPTHPHRDMEIVTYVIEGQLEHQDRLGNRAVVHPGEVQVMSAGKGITHSEYNPSRTEKLHLFQLWIEPRHKGNMPRWEQKQFTKAQREGKLLPVVSNGTREGTLAIDQDATIHVGKLKKGQKLEHAVDGTHAYVFVIDGAVKLNGEKLDPGDQARIADEKTLKLDVTKDAEVMVIDLP